MVFVWERPLSSREILTCALGLTREHGWLLVTVMVLGLVIAVIDPISGVLPVWSSILTWLFGLVYLPFHAALSAVLYANARIRSEGYTGGATSAVVP